METNAIKNTFIAIADDFTNKYYIDTYFQDVSRRNVMKYIWVR